jgi:hypothetical protein
VIVLSAIRGRTVQRCPIEAITTIEVNLRDGYGTLQFTDLPFTCGEDNDTRVPEFEQCEVAQRVRELVLQLATAERRAMGIFGSN